MKMSTSQERGLLPSTVSAPKTGFAYRAHSYPTKIPPEAILPFIETCTQEGDIVLDPFCGSGMTGVAAMQSGRRAILSDLSPGAVHIAIGHTRPSAPDEMKNALETLDRQWMKRRERSLYESACPTCGEQGTTRHMIWSDILACPECADDMILFDFASAQGQVPRDIECTRCGCRVTRFGRRSDGSVPVQVTVACAGECRTLQTGRATEVHAENLRRIARRRLRYWVPSDPIGSDREMYKRSALHLRNVESVSDFYLPRAKLALGELWDRIAVVESESIRAVLKFAFTNTAWHSSRMRRYNATGGQRPLTGTLYIPQLVAEANVFEVFRNQVRQLARYYEILGESAVAPVEVRVASATDLSWLETGSVDYVFTDPPFGSNIFYADCNLVWEAWLGSVTDSDMEIVVNKSRTLDEGGKSVGDYQRLLTEAFSEIARVLKPKGRASIVFHNSDDAIWSALLSAAEDAGLRQQHVSILDKVQRSMKGYKGRSGSERVPFYDLIITFGRGSVERLNGAGEVAALIIDEHMSFLKRSNAPVSDDRRSLEYLYSLAVSGVIERDVVPEGLSYRAFESICNARYARQGRFFSSE